MKIIRFLILVFLVSCSIQNHAFALKTGTNLHHVFPQEFERKHDYWSHHNIDHHLYCVPLSQKQHVKLHNMGGNQWYNKEWESFIKQNPNTNKATIFGFAISLS